MHSTVYIIEQIKNEFIYTITSLIVRRFINSIIVEAKRTILLFLPLFILFLALFSTMHSKTKSKTNTKKTSKRTNQSKVEFLDVEDNIDQQTDKHTTQQQLFQSS